MEKATVYRNFRDAVDTERNIRAWTEKRNAGTRRKASLDKGEKPASGRFHAERVLKLLDKKQDDWDDEDFTFAARVVNYANRSAGIARNHPHNHDAEIGDTGMTKNEIARRNWGLPATP